MTTVNIYEACPPSGSLHLAVTIEVPNIGKVIFTSNREWEDKAEPSIIANYLEWGFGEVGTLRRKLGQARGMLQEIIFEKDLKGDFGQKVQDCIAETAHNPLQVDEDIEGLDIDSLKHKCQEQRKYIDLLVTAGKAQTQFTQLLARAKGRLMDLQSKLPENRTVADTANLILLEAMMDGM